MKIPSFVSTFAAVFAAASVAAVLAYGAGSRRSVRPPDAPGPVPADSPVHAPEDSGRSAANPADEPQIVLPENPCPVSPESAAGKNGDFLREEPEVVANRPEDEPEDEPEDDSGELADGTGAIVNGTPSGSVEERLERLRSRFSDLKRRADRKTEEPGEAYDDPDADPDDPEGPDFAETVNWMGEALADPDPEVRNLAFSMLGELTYEEFNVLSLQILDGTDDDLKRKLLDDASRADDEFSATLLMQALDNASPEIGAKAKQALRDVFSETFSSTGEALAWWEENRAAFMGGSDGNGAADPENGFETEAGN